jgi:hypothetical protein
MADSNQYLIQKMQGKKQDMANASSVYARTVNKMKPFKKARFFADSFARKS